MPRFKQPLMGLSRLSDRVGGGGSVPVVVAHRDAAGNSVSIPSMEAGDICLVFAGRTSTTTPGIPSGFTTIKTHTVATVSMRACVLTASSALSAQTLTSSTATSICAIIIRGGAGIGATSTYAPGGIGTVTGVGAIPEMAEGSRIIVGSWTQSLTQGQYNSPSDYQGINNIMGVLSPMLACTVNPASTSFPLTYLTQTNTTSLTIAVEVLAA